MSNGRMKWEKLLSTKRVSALCPSVKTDKSKSDDYNESEFMGHRNPYDRDNDQIIFSYPFRRLQDKTQVIPFPEFDFVHTRLTHSLEVASVGRSLGKLVAPFILEELKDNPTYKGLCASDIGTLVGSACLAHDIGNPPFGHSGESAISYYFTKKNDLFKGHNTGDLDLEKIQMDLNNFEGNANGFRILTKDCHKGVNPTLALLGAFTKYPRESYTEYLLPQTKEFSKYGFFQSERKLFSLMADELGLLPVDNIGANDLAYHRHPLSYLMEAADDISYGIIDFEDGCRLGLIDFEKVYGVLKFWSSKHGIKEYLVKASPKDILIHIAEQDSSFSRDRLDKIDDYKEAISYLRAKVINVLTLECHKVFEKNYDKIMTGTYGKSLIDDIENEQIKNSIFKMKKLIKKYIYNYPPVLQSEASGFEVMYKLIENFSISCNTCISCNTEEDEKTKKFVSLLPEEYRPVSETQITILDSDEVYMRFLRILDYVSGMTDNYSSSIFRKTTGLG